MTVAKTFQEDEETKKNKKINRWRKNKCVALAVFWFSCHANALFNPPPTFHGQLGCAIRMSIKVTRH